MLCPVAEQHHNGPSAAQSPLAPRSDSHLLRAFFAPALTDLLWQLKLPCSNLVNRQLLLRTSWLKSKINNTLHPTLQFAVQNLNLSAGSETTLNVYSYFPQIFMIMSAKIHITCTYTHINPSVYTQTQAHKGR